MPAHNLIEMSLADAAEVAAKQDVRLESRAHRLATLRGRRNAIAQQLEQHHQLFLRDTLPQRMEFDTATSVIAASVEGRRSPIIEAYREREREQKEELQRQLAELQREFETRAADHIAGFEAAIADRKKIFDITQAPLRHEIEKLDNQLEVLVEVFQDDAGCSMDEAFQRNIGGLQTFHLNLQMEMIHRTLMALRDQQEGEPEPAPGPVEIPADPDPEPPAPDPADPAAGEPRICNIT